jgi:hypothetical protein
MPSRPSRPNKNILKNMVVVDRPPKMKQTDIVLQFLNNNKGIFYPKSDIMLGCGMSGGGGTTLVIRTLVMKGLIKEKECECHRNALFGIDL